jgi:hypothetical protein
VRPGDLHCSEYVSSYSVLALVFVQRTVSKVKITVHPRVDQSSLQAQNSEMPSTDPGSLAGCHAREPGTGWPVLVAGWAPAQAFVS